MKQKAAKPKRKALLALGALLAGLALFTGLLPLAALAETGPESRLPILFTMMCMI